MAAHTPGPWRVGEKRHDYADIVIRVIRNRENHPVTMTCYAGYTRRTGDANARLIAAAPELLAALEQALAVIGSDEMRAACDMADLHGMPYRGPTVDRAAMRNLIAKVRGEADPKSKDEGSTA